MFNELWIIVITKKRLFFEILSHKNYLQKKSDYKSYHFFFANAIQFRNNQEFK